MRRPFPPVAAARRRRGGTRRTARDAAADRGNRRHADNLQEQSLQLRRRHRRRQNLRRRAEKLHSELLGVLREPLVLVGTRHPQHDDTVVRTGRPFRQRPAILRRGDDLRHRDLRGFVGSRPAVVRYGVERSETDIQPLGDARNRRQARLHPLAHRAAVSPHALRLRILFGGHRRILDRPRIHGQRSDCRERNYHSR